MKFFDPFDEIFITRNRLPHWQQAGATFFLTFRLADSLPDTLLKEWREEKSLWLSAHPPPLSPEEENEFHLRFSSQIDEWLDSGRGSCLLLKPAHRESIQDSLSFFDHVRYHLYSWIAMPNHFHACFTLHPDWSLEKVVFTWKRRSAGEINRIRGGEGTIWMADYFDRLIRDKDHFSNVIRYIRHNPGKARLSPNQYTIWESELARSIL